MINIKGGVIIDANGVRNDPAIIIKDDRITEVGSSKTLVAPQNAEVVNASSLVELYASNAICTFVSVSIIH